MRFVLIITSIFLLYTNGLALGEVTDNDKEAMRDAMELISVFMWDYEGIPLFPLRDFASEGIEKSCRFTQPKLEGMIRQYTLKYDGKISRERIAHTMNRLVVAFGLYADELHDHDGNVTYEEVRALTLGARSSNAMTFLFCLFDVYLKK